MDDRSLAARLYDALIDGYVGQSLDNWAGGNHWSWAVLDVLLSDAPELGWPVLCEVVQRAPEEALGYLGAGPLEDLLARHGERSIAAIEREARRNPRLRIALAGVWRNTIAEPVWLRVQALIDDEAKGSLETIEAGAQTSAVSVGVGGRPPTVARDLSTVQQDRRDALLEAFAAAAGPAFVPWRTPVSVEVHVEWALDDAPEAAAADVLAAIVETLATDRGEGLTRFAPASIGAYPTCRLVRHVEITEARASTTSYQVAVLRMADAQVEALNDSRPFEEVLAEAEMEAEGMVRDAGADP